MARAFEGFRERLSTSPVVWQEHDSLFAYECQQCRRTFPHGGKRWLASSMTKMSMYAAVCICDDCKNGNDPNAVKRPKLSDRRTTLD